MNPRFKSLVAGSAVIAFFAHCLAFSALASTPPGSAQSRGAAKGEGTEATVLNPAFKIVSQNSRTGITEYKLKSNGLNVLMAERHASPVVTVMIVYRVGSRNEAVGYTGATHFLEHMMFKGTSRHDPLKGTGIDDVLKPVGAMNNATTFFDRTCYYEVAPASSLDLCLELEADRMRHALLRESDRQSEMTVVRNELERNENYAANILDTQVFATAFREHPYHHPVIGWRSDVEGVPIARLRQFYNDFYYPDNATLIVIGDFQTGKALAQINKHFGAVPKAPRPFPKVYTVEPPQQGMRRFEVIRGEESPKLLLGFHVPRATEHDTYPLEVLASILGDQDRHSSRLFKKVADARLASHVSAYNYSLRDPGLFTIYASAAKDVPLEKVEKAIMSELEELSKKPVSDNELERAKNAVWKKLKLQASDPMGMAQQLAEAIAVADWHWWVDLEKNIKAVTKDDIMRVAGKYFSGDLTTCGYYHPREKVPASDITMPVLGLPEAEYRENPSPSSEPDAGKDSCLAAVDETSDTTFKSPPAGRRAGDEPAGAKAGLASSDEATLTARQKTNIAAAVKRRQLANGLTVLSLHIPNSGVVAVGGKVKGGHCVRSRDKTLVPELVSRLLTMGSLKVSKEEMADKLELMGTTFDPDVHDFWIGFDSEVVVQDVDAFMELLSASLREPRFDEEDVDKTKKVLESELKDALSSTAQVAYTTFLSTAYPPSCTYYEKPLPQQIEELSGITDSDLRMWHQEVFNPSNMVLVVVGDMEADAVFALVEKHFRGWAKGDPKSIEESCAPISRPKTLVVRTIPDKSSVDVVMGRAVPLSIRSKDFYAALIANSALGHDTIASRLAELREKHGLTYGVSSTFLETSQQNGPWVVQLTVNPENTVKSIRLVRDIVEKYRSSGISLSELTAEKSRLAGEYVVHRMRTPRQMADALSKYELLGLGPEFMDNYASNLARVTKGEVDEAVRKYMGPRGLVTTVAGSINSQALRELDDRKTAR